MQRSVSILSGIFLSALIVYGGSGVNTYFYCCGDCRVEGPGAVVEHKYCEIHHHQHGGCTIIQSQKPPDPSKEDYASLLTTLVI